MIKPSRRFVVRAAGLDHVHLRTPVGAVVILQTGHHLEKVETPKHRLFYRHCDGSFANHLRMDAEQNSDGIYSEKSRSEQNQPGESSLIIALD